MWILGRRDLSILRDAAMKIGMKVLMNLII